MALFAKWNWEGQQILPAQWVQESTHSIGSDFPGAAANKYGYLWWTSESVQAYFPAIDLGPHSFMIEGVGGQFLVVSPKQQLVIVSFSTKQSLAKNDPNFDAAKLGAFLSILFEAKNADN